ncbi:MAG: metal-dependent hydrolase [Rubrobacteraceae bacterium]
MTGATHQAGALLAAGLYAQVMGLSPALAVTTAAGAFAAARLPDIDAPRDPEDPRCYDHRRGPHSLLLAGGGVLLVALLAVAAFGYPPTRLGEGEHLFYTLVQLYQGSTGKLAAVVAVGATLGYLSHLLLDLFTTKGIWLLRPGGLRLALPVVRKGGLPEPLVLITFAFALIPTLVIPLLKGVVEGIVSL